MGTRSARFPVRNRAFASHTPTQINTRKRPMEMPFKSANEITAMAASCFPLARAAATGIEQDVLELVVPEAKCDAKALLAILRRSAIFEKGVLAMLRVRKQKARAGHPRTGPPITRKSTVSPVCRFSVSTAEGEAHGPHELDRSHRRSCRQARGPGGQLEGGHSGRGKIILASDSGQNKEPAQNLAAVTVFSARLDKPAARRKTSTRSVP